MEDTRKQQPEPEGKKEAIKETNPKKATEKVLEKDWWEQLLGTTEQDGVKNIYKLLTHPLALVGVFVFLLVWLLKQKKPDSIMSKENEELKSELAFIKKKYKKLKKRLNKIREDASNYASVNPDKPVKRPVVLVD
jgi:hypothetical protein